MRQTKLRIHSGRQPVRLPLVRRVPRRSDQAVNASDRHTKAKTLTLHILRRLANEWCPTKATWVHLLDDTEYWGPAHELGHALIETPDRWKKLDYGRCALGFCQCGSERCDVYEAAAMRISAALVKAAGQPELSEREIIDTGGYDRMTDTSRRRSIPLLKRKGLWPVPVSERSLKAALKRRLGKPRGNRQH